MLKRYTFWLKAAVVFQFLSGAIHSVSLFLTPTADDPTEGQMLNLIMTYKMDMGAGFHPTFFNLFIALSSCFTFICFFAALTNGYLLSKHTAPKVMRGIIAINLLIFGALLAVVAYFTFLLPITCMGLIFVSLLAAFIAVPKIESAL
ncbi:MAG TPA: hypothetical protein VHQ01_09915 [Pyrinomonadaceae bacterium]|nr:hypothetical protein [Pyrinomonadaceae bacterium]